MLKKVIFSNKTLDEVCPYKCDSKAIVDDCRLLKERYKQLPNFMIDIKRPEKFICMRNLKKKFQVQQVKSIEKGNLEILNNAAKGKVKSLLREEYKKKKEFKKKDFKKSKFFI